MLNPVPRLRSDISVYFEGDKFGLAGADRGIDQFVLFHAFTTMPLLEAQAAYDVAR